MVSGAPLGSLGSFWELLWISPVGSLALEAFWAPFCMLLGLFPSSVKAFGHPMETFLLVSSMTFILQINICLKFVFLLITFLFYVAVCDVTWSAELPEGSIFML